MVGVSIVALAFLVIPILMVVALIDMLRRPQSQWESAGQNQIVWVLLVVFVPLIGIVLYYVVARTSLEQAARATPTA